MKVKELIEVLKQFNENKQVDICGIDDVAVVETETCIWIDSKAYMEQEEAE